jgi:hypothetical protein
MSTVLKSSFLFIKWNVKGKIRAADLIPRLYVIFKTEMFQEFVCFLLYAKQQLWFWFIVLCAGL